MKTIIRLVILAAITVMPFMADAQMNVQRIENPEWFKHLIGKTLEEMEEMGFTCDSLDWGRNNISSTWSMSFARYTLYEGEHEGKYHFYFEKDSEEPVCKAKPWKILYIVPEHKRTPAKNEEEDKEESITNPEWYKHLLGKQLKDVSKELECDSLKWMHINYLGGNRHVSTYVLLDGDTLRQYSFYYETPEGKSSPEALLTEIIRRDKITLSLYNEFTGATARMLQSLPTENNTTPSEEVWLKFWEVKIKNDIKKDLKESK